MSRSRRGQRLSSDANRSNAEGTTTKLLTLMHNRQYRLIEGRYDSAHQEYDAGLPMLGRQTHGQLYYYISQPLPTDYLKIEFGGPSAGMNNIGHLISKYRQRYEHARDNLTPNQATLALNNFYNAVDRAQQYVQVYERPDRYASWVATRLNQFLNSQRFYFTELSYRVAAPAPVEPQDRNNPLQVVACLQSSLLDLDKYIPIYSYSRSFFRPKQFMSFREYLHELLSEPPNSTKHLKGRTILTALQNNDEQALTQTLSQHRHGYKFMHFSDPIGLTIYKGCKNIPELNQNLDRIPWSLSK